MTYAVWRYDGDPCPKIGGTIARLDNDHCGSCRFWRGGSSWKDEKALCNWPHDGSYVEPASDPFNADWWNQQLGE